jgi:hypothetical protein
MIKIKTFDNELLSKTEKKEMNKQGFRSLHTDHINNKIVVTFVKGTDDPHNSEESKALQIKSNEIKKLRSKLQDNSINFEELKELMRSGI